MVQEIINLDFSLYEDLTRFPPISLDDPEELEAPESDREQQIITEVWVEPQYGRVVGSPPEREHFDGMDYTQLAVAVSWIMIFTLVIAK